MQKRSLVRVMVAIFLGTVLPLSLEAADVFLDITKGGEGKLRIAVADFIDQSPVREDLSYQIRRILNNDLRMTGFFEPIENEGFLKEVSLKDQEEGSVVFKEWSLLGAQHLVKGEYTNSKDDLSLGFHLFDVNQGKLVAQKGYQAPAGQLRQMVHKFADEMFYLLTGERGIAQTQIAFVAKSSGFKDLYVMDYDGFNPRRWTRNSSILLSPSWSPQGDQIVYTLYKRNNPSLYVLDLMKKSQKSLSSYPGLNTAPAWSPDGKRIALVLSKDGNPDIYIMDRDGSHLQRLTFHSGIDSAPSWSPNGREIAFTSDRGGTPQLYLMDAEGANVRRITFEGSYNDQAAWSPKGDKIAFSGRVGGRFQIFWISPGGGQPQQLTSLEGSSESPAWAPNGRKIAFSSTRYGVPQIYSININGSELQQLTFLEGGCSQPTWSPWKEEG